MYFQRVAVDNASLSDKIVGQAQARHNGENQCDRGSTHSNDLVATANLADWISASSRVASAPAGSRAARIVKLRAAPPASLGASPEQNRVHRTSEFINLPDAVILYNFANRGRWPAVQPAKRVNFVPACPFGRRQGAAAPFTRRGAESCHARRGQGRQDCCVAGFAQDGGTRGKAPAPTFWNPCSVLAAGTNRGLRGFVPRGERS